MHIYIYFDGRKNAIWVRISKIIPSNLFFNFVKWIISKFSYLNEEFVVMLNKKYIFCSLSYFSAKNTGKTVQTKVIKVKDTLSLTCHVNLEVHILHKVIIYKSRCELSISAKRNSCFTNLNKIFVKTFRKMNCLRHIYFLVMDQNQPKSQIISLR